VRAQHRVLLALYLASGLGAVAIETVWMRWLRTVLGATAPAVSATLVAFFLGHALGAAWAARATARSARPLALYARLELAAVAAAALVPLGLLAGEHALAPVYDRLREAPTLLTLARFAIALAASLPAAFCFGATFPAIAAAAVGAPRALGAQGGALYAVNTLGAAVGCALATFVLPGAVGVRVTYAVALVALALASGGAFALARRGFVASMPAPEAALPADPTPSEDTAEPPRTRAQARRARKEALRRARPASAPPLPRLRAVERALGARGLTLLAGVSGFGAFALQVLLVQSFAQVSNQSIFAFGAVLVAVLLAIAAAGALVAAIDRAGWLDPRTVLGASLVASSLALAAFPAWLERVTGGFAYVGGAGGGLAYFGALFAVVVAAAGVPLLVGALLFPATLASAGRLAGAAASGPLVARLLVANTAGAIAGALVAPFLLIPRVGLWPAFGTLALGYALAAVFVPEPNLRRRIRRDLVLFVGWVIVVMRANPLGVAPVALAPGESLLAVEPTPSGIVAVVEREGERLIRVDNHYALGGTAEIVHQQRQAHLPLVLAPEARRVAYAGSATGISAGGALRHPVESLALVELVPAVARAAERFFGDANRGVYRDPRTAVVLDDARNFLRFTAARFDVVVGDLFVPWQAGAGGLYARAHFAAVRERLAPGGLFCQWLPLYQLGEAEVESIAATFLDVFPTAAVFRGDFYGRYPIAALVGWRDAPAAPDAIAAATQALAKAGATDRWVTDPMGPWSLYVAPLGPMAAAFEGVPRNTDDRPVVERLAAATHAGGSTGKLDPLVGPRWIAFTNRLREAARASGDPLGPERGIDERRAIDGGAALQLAGALYTAGDVEGAARAFTRAAELLPARLVADAPEDPTAAELWSSE
jgi:spermidine synthase